MRTLLIILLSAVTCLAGVTGGGGSGGGGSANVVTGLAPWERLVAPSVAFLVTNYGVTSAQVTGSGNIFTADVYGSNYVRLAFNSFQVNSNYPTDKQQVFSGVLEVIGNNYFHGPLVLTNRSGIFNITICAPSFSSGWLISDTNPCITTAMDHFRGLALDIHDLGISSTVNQPTNLVQIYIVDSLLFTHNMMGPWNALTNNTQLVSGPWLNGLITSSDGISARNNINVKHNLVCEFQNGGEADEYIVENNYFMWMAGVFWNPDHGVWNYNKIYHSGAVATNSDWDQGNSLWIGATMVIGQGTSNDWVFNHTFFYDDTAGYMLSDVGGLWKTYNDFYESTPLSQIEISFDDGFTHQYIYQLDVNGAPTIGGSAIYDDQGDYSIFNTPDATDGAGFTSITGPLSSYIGGFYGNQFVAPSGITFTGNGQNLTNLLARALLGNNQLPVAVIPTNVPAISFNTTGTNTFTMGTTGYTNLNPFNVRVFELQGTSLVFTNLTSKFGFSLGTLSVNSDFLTLYTNECIIGTGVTGKITQ